MSLKFGFSVWEGLKIFIKSQYTMYMWRPKMPKKRNETALQLTDRNSEAYVVITASRTVEPEKLDKDDPRKPLYLKRV
jgi:hypothetical protein